MRCEGSRDGYHDMVQFIGTFDYPDRTDRLAVAIEGRGAFRQFRDVLARWPGELDRWYGYADDRQRGWARSWLAEGGGRPRAAFELSDTGETARPVKHTAQLATPDAVRKDTKPLRKSFTAGPGTAPVASGSLVNALPRSVATLGALGSRVVLAWGRGGGERDEAATIGGW